jgi:hypothetical protein
MGAASELGKAGVGVEEGAAQRGQQQRQYNATTGTEMATGIERDTTARKTSNTMDRQAVNRANQATKFGQGMDVQAAKRQGAQQVADKRLEAQYRGQDYLTRAEAGSTADKNQELDRQMNAWQIQSGQQQSAAQAQAAKEAQPKLWEKVVGAASGAVGAAIPAVGMAQKFTGGLVKKPAPTQGYGVGAWDS